MKEQVILFDTKEQNVFFTSDTHFWHENIIKFCNRPFGSIEEMNNTIIENWNKVVGENDIVFHLGDFCFCGSDKFKEIIENLNGRIYLILGNHDRGASYYANVFDEVYTGPVIIAEKLILSHEPIDFPYAANIHGHDHSNRGFKDGLHINCCAEHINLTPICLSHIVKSGLLKNTINIHREAIDKAKDHKK